MRDNQRKQNPDVNSYNPDIDPAESPDVTNDRGDQSSNIERGPKDEPIPVPPDSGPAAPIEEPPGRDGSPVGDVDDSPKQIA
jgi:hypothetical protein